MSSTSVWTLNLTRTCTASNLRTEVHTLCTSQRSTSTTVTLESVRPPLILHVPMRPFLLWCTLLTHSSVIVPYHQPPIGPTGNLVDPTLVPSGTFTIGDGAGGGGPYTYFLREGQDIDVGFLKFFISTMPINLENIPQPSPFQDPARASATLVFRPPPLWDTVMLTIVQRRRRPMETSNAGRA